MAIGVKVAKGSSQKARARRHFRVRKKIAGTTARPRLVVSRSTRHLFVQIVDDSIGQTIVSASTMDMHFAKILQVISLQRRKSLDNQLQNVQRKKELLLWSLTAVEINTTVV